MILSINDHKLCYATETAQRFTGLLINHVGELTSGNFQSVARFRRFSLPMVFVKLFEQVIDTS